MIIFSTLARYKVLHFVLGAVLVLICLIFPKSFVVLFACAIGAVGFSGQIDKAAKVQEFSIVYLGWIATVLGGVAVVVLWHFLGKL